MIRAPDVLGPGATVGAVRAEFADDHIHAVVVVDAGMLVSVVERADVVGVADDVPAGDVGALDGRVIGPDEDAEATRRAMVDGDVRRLAVVDGGRFLGLLCLTRSGKHFCTEEGIRARAAERRPAR